MPGSAFLNTAHWSLIVELRISPIFPAVIWIARRIRFRQTLALTFVGSFLTANPQQTTYFGLLLFLNGSALAVHREQVAAVWRGLSRAAKILLLVVACARIATPMRFP
jgi:peptidoglycan/LPS O-acetylase OafA/YrhL